MCRARRSMRCRNSYNEMYEDDNTKAILLVNASNAFNSLNHQAALRNVHILCPILAPVLINAYRLSSAPYVFTKVMKPVIVAMRRLRIRLITG